ncbi:MAG TPA: sulfite exporter TauE/SafE family protein [Acidimicrobiia bacterium]|nr:sulfite exporter TauE/SafE family protein [Acidimicrobiia bacterium]
MSGRENPASVGALLGIGVATGVLAGLLGVGGGIIIVPALVAVGYTRQEANAASLATILLVAVSGTIGFALSDSVDVPFGLAMGVGGLAGATLGAHWAHRLSGVALARFFGLLLILAGFRFIIAGGTPPAGGAVVDFPLDLVVAALAGVLAGVVSGLAGIGGGLIMVPAMVLLLGLTQHTAEGTSLLAIIFTAAAATRVNIGNRHVDWRAVWLLSIPGVVMAPLAAVFAQQIPADTLARVFGVFVLTVAARTLWKANEN